MKTIMELSGECYNVLQDIVIYGGMLRDPELAVPEKDKWTSREAMIDFVRTASAWFDRNRDDLRNAATQTPTSPDEVASAGKMPTYLRERAAEIRGNIEADPYYYPEMWSFSARLLADTCDYWVGEIAKVCQEEDNGAIIEDQNEKCNEIYRGDLVRYFMETGITEEDANKTLNEMLACENAGAKFVRNYSTLLDKCKNVSNYVFPRLNMLSGEDRYKYSTYSAVKSMRKRQIG